MFQYIHNRTGNIINVKVPITGGDWRPLKAASAVSSKDPDMDTPALENDAQTPENDVLGDTSMSAPAADLDTGAATPPPAASGPKKPTPRPGTRKTPAKKPAAKKSSSKKSGSKKK
nr:hypothetical protein [uncultured Dysosmobacter sp.]